MPADAKQTNPSWPYPKDRYGLRRRIGPNGLQCPYPFLGLVDQLVYCPNGVRVGHGSAQPPQLLDAVAYPFVLGWMSHPALTLNRAFNSFSRPDFPLRHYLPVALRRRRINLE